MFCTTALFTWKLDPTDVSRMAGHANYRITLDMYIGATPASSTAPAQPPNNHVARHHVNYKIAHTLC